MILLLAEKNKSVLLFKKWVKRLILLLRRKGRDNTAGTDICETNGYIM